MMNDDDLLNWARFVATKFTSNTDGWKYTRDTGDLVHIRYKSDTTGYEHWTKRLGRAIRATSPVAYIRPRGFMEFFTDKNKSLKGYFIHAYAYFLVYFRKEKHLPDGILNGNPVFWEEDGEYGVLFGPTVGVKVLDFIAAEPENPHAKAIVEEMRRMALMSFPGEELEDDPS